MPIDLSENISLGSNSAKNFEKEEELRPINPLKNLYKTEIKQDEQKSNIPDKIGREELSSKEKRLLRELKKIARRVRRHERAHKNVAGKYAGRIYYEYTEGPNGKRYPTEGYINLDTKKIRKDPDENIEKMETIRKAALAPQKPSQKDREIAMDAQQKEMRSRMKLMRKKTKQIDSNYKDIGKNSNSINEQGIQSENKTFTSNVNIIS